MTTYTFDFGRLTSEDIERGKNGNLVDMIFILNRICTCGVTHLPMREVVEAVIPQFCYAFDEWWRHGSVGDLLPKPKVYDAPEQDMDDDALRDMLDGIEGL